MSVLERTRAVFGGLFGEDTHTSSSNAKPLKDELKTGQRVGEYVIESKLGSGGFGSVYSAVHPLIGKRAAVKVLHHHISSNPEMVSRFIAEARAVNQIRHRHIIDIFSFGALEDNRHYYVMEMLDGVPLDAYLNEVGSMPVSETLAILNAIAKALEAAHAAGVVHRDLKPENIFLVRDEEGFVFPKILDFGVAKLLRSGSQGQAHKTRTGVPIGSPRYMSPEQCQGHSVDHRADIYALGVISFRMLSGRLPFDADSALDLMMQHVAKVAPDLSSVAENLDVAFDAPISKMLEKDPDNRPNSVVSAVSDLLDVARRLGLVREDWLTAGPALGSAFTALGERRRLAFALDETLPQSARDAAKATSLAAIPKRLPYGRPLAFGAVAVVVFGVAAWLGMKSGGSPALPVSSSGDPDSGQKIATPSPELTVPSSAPSSASSVSISFQARPANAEIFLGDLKLGTSPGPFLLPKAAESANFTLKASGFAPASVVVPLSRDSVVSVNLKAKDLPRADTTAMPKDLEDPYKK